MKDLEKRIRREAVKLIAVGVAIGFLIGLAVGATITYYSIERTVVIPFSEGIRA